MNKSIAMATFLAVGTAGSGSALAQDQSVCLTLARQLRPDVLHQASDWSRFEQIQQLLKDEFYDDWNRASSSSSQLNGSLSIPGIVDAAIGDGGKSDSSSWQKRRSDFLSMNFEDTREQFRKENLVSKISVAAIKEISDCAQKLADAYGAFVMLDTVSSNFDAFTIKLAYRTGGKVGDWKLTSLYSVGPEDPLFNCKGFEQAKDGNEIQLETMTKTIGCTKSPDKHLTVVVNTTQGGGTTFTLNDSVEAMQAFEESLNKLSSRLAEQEQRSRIIMDTYTQPSPDLKTAPPVTCSEGYKIVSCSSLRVPSGAGNCHITISSDGKKCTTDSCVAPDGDNYRTEALCAKLTLQK